MNMAYEIYKKQGCVIRNLGIIRASDSAKAALEASKTHGKGLYKVRPEDSLDGFYPYRVK
jgi:hypothetical protein